MSADRQERPGRDGLLRLSFTRRGDATLLRRCRYTLPLQALAPFTLDDGACYLLLLNPTGGVLGGDRLRTEIACAEGARVCLSTPSATRVYRSSGAAAEVDTILRVGPGATLEYLPDHLIPHPGSRLRQSLRVEMERGSRGIFFEGFSAGRVALHELWQFREFDSRTEVFLGGRPVFANRTKILGAPPSPASFPNSPPAFTSIPGAPTPLPDVAVSLPGVVIPASERLPDVVIPSGAAAHQFEPTPSRHVVIPSEADAYAHSIEAPPFGGVEGSALPMKGSELQLRHNSAAGSGALAPEADERGSIAASNKGIAADAPLPDAVVPSGADAHMRRIEKSVFGGVEGSAFPSAQSPPPLRHPAHPHQFEPTPSRNLVIPSERFGDPARVAQSEPRDLSSNTPAAPGRMGGYSYSGFLLLIADEFGHWPALLKNLRDEIEAMPGIFGGASLLAHSGCAVRYLAHSAIEFHAATERLWTVARRHLLGLPPFALRKY